MEVQPTTYHEVRRDFPCPVCDARDGCMLGEDGSIQCRGGKGTVPGFWNGPKSKKDAQWVIYRRLDDPLYRAGQLPEPIQMLTENGRGKKRADSQRAEPWSLTAQRYARDLSPARAQELAHALGLPVWILEKIPMIGWYYDSRHGSTFTFPMRDEQGEICGLQKRHKDGKKPNMKGSASGLFVPLCWEEMEGPLYLPEGPSDVLSYLLLGRAAIGRPSNLAGVEALAAYLADFPAGRQIILSGEWDMKPNGDWPGKEGAMSVAAQLATRLKRPVHWTFPPRGFKDARAFVVEHGQGVRDEQGWRQWGADYEAKLQLQEVQPAQPEVKPKGLKTTPYSQIDPEVMHYLVPGYLPKGELVVIAGDGGQGKSMILAHIAARITQGECCFGLEYTPEQPHTVLIANCEDHRAKVMRPRLEAAGADLSRVREINGPEDMNGNVVPFSFLHIQDLRDTLEADLSIKLVIIDPASSYVGPTGLNDSLDTDVKQFLDPLSKICQDLNLTIILVKHFNKGSSGVAGAKISGAAAYINTARIVFMVFPETGSNERKLFLCHKINGGVYPDGLVYTVQPADAGCTDRVWRAVRKKIDPVDEANFKRQLALAEWIDTTDVTTNEACSEAVLPEPENFDELGRARRFVVSFLANGARLRDEVVAAGNEEMEVEHDHRWWRAKVLKKIAGAKPRKQGGTKDGRWYWCLKNQLPPAYDEGAQQVEETEETEETGG